MQYLWQFYALVGVIGIQGLCLRMPSRINKWLFSVLCFLELFFIAGFRAGHIGNDTQGYIDVFISSINHSDFFNFYMERGYLIFNNLLAAVTSTPQMILVVTSLFIIGIWMYTFYKYSVSVVFSVVLFVIFGFDTTLTMVRQEMALCIILLALPLIINRKFLLFLIACVCASTFHTTALLALVLYFLYPLPFKPRYILWILLGTVISFFFLAPLLEQVITFTGRYENYLGNRLLGEETKLASIMKAAVQLAIAGFCYFSYKYFYRKEKSRVTPISVSFLLWCSLLAVCLQFLSIRGTLLERLVLYFSAFNFLAIPFFVQCYPKNSRIFIGAMVVGFFLMYQSIIFVYRPEWNYVLPFKFCF